MSRKKILVPIDINQNSTDLLLYAGSLASAIQARLSCVAIMEDILDSEMQENVPSLQRRKVELSLSKIVNEIFKQGKPVFDIIVTKGDFVNRILQMTNDLGIDLIVVKSLDFDVLKPIIAQLASAFIIVNNSVVPSKQLVLPVNLDASYYIKIQDSIDVAQMLNANLKIMSYTYYTKNEDKYKERLSDIKNMVEHENIACVTTFTRLNANSEAFLENMLIELDGELPLLTFDDLEELESLTGLSEFLQSSSSILLSTKKKYLQKAQSIKQHSWI